MTKRRMIHDCIWQSEGFAGLTYRQRCLWVGLITTADDQGRARAHPGLVRAAVFPFDVITQDEIASDLQAIEDLEMLVVYQVEDKAYYQILNWWEYQHPQWVGPSDHPAPEGWLDRLRYHGPGHEVITENWQKSKADKPPDKLPDKPALAEEEVEEKGREEGKGTTTDSASYRAILAVYIEVFPDKPKPRKTTKSHIAKTKTRMKDTYFAENWEKALRRAARGRLCHDQGWFDMTFFLRDEINWEKCLNGNYDDAKPRGGGNGRKATGMDAFDEFEKAMGWGDSQGAQSEEEVIDVEYSES